MRSKKVRAKEAISGSGILTRLESYSPEVVSTIFVGLDTHKSDIDIICTYREQGDFINDLSKTLSTYHTYRIKTYDNRVVGKFHFDEFVFEVYATATPVKQQLAYRHYQIMKRLVAIGGVDFAEKVKKLKKSGFKTEPAICRVLNISGDPYRSILAIENWTDTKIEEHMASHM